MGLKVFNITPSVLASSKHCRLDEKYASFTEVEDWMVFSSKYEQIPLSSFIEPLPIVKYKKGELDSDYHLVNISDQEQRSGQLENIEEINEIGSDKNYLGDADIFVSKLGMPKGYIFLNTYKGKDILGSTEFIPYVFKKEKYQVFLKFILLHPKMLNAYAFLESGKTPSHRRVNPYEFLKIKIPLLPNENLNNISREIKPLLNELIELKSSLINPLTVINKAFSKEFNFDENLFNLFGKGMTASTQIAEDKTLSVFETNFSELSKSNICRFSTRFHNEPTKQIMEFLNSINTIKVKDILIEVVHRGASPKYNQEGEIPVVKTGHLKNQFVVISQEEFVDEEFFNTSSRSRINSGDILIASTGKGSLGKIDFYEGGDKLVADGHVSIVRINTKKYSSLFFTYFFRSILGYFQIERDYTGATNQIELGKNEISDFKIPDIDINEQNRIVEDIQLKLRNQQTAKELIIKRRLEIFNIIDKYVN